MVNVVKCGQLGLRDTPDDKSSGKDSWGYDNPILASDQPLQQPPDTEPSPVMLDARRDGGGCKEMEDEVGKKLLWERERERGRRGIPYSP